MRKDLKAAFLAAAVTGLSLSCTSAIYAADGWQKDEAGQWVYYEDEQQTKQKWIADAAGNYYYVDSKGVMVSNAAAKIDGSYYFFDSDGHMAKDGWCAATKTNESTGKVTYTWYFADPEGKLYCDNWYTIGDGSFYFAKDGRAVRGGVATVGDQKFYIDKDKGCLGQGGGWLPVIAERALPTDAVRTTWYYTEENGALYYGGWKDIDGASFYFNNGGVAVRDGIVTVEEKKYYIDGEKGCLGLNGGWFSVDTMDSAGKTTTRSYYANEDASLLFDGWYEVDGVRQYFDKSCVNYKNRWFTLEDQKIYVDETGAQQQPGWFSISGVNSNGVEYINWYYLDENYNLMPEGFREMDGHIRYFDKNGLNYRKRWYVDEEKNRYYLDEDGYLQKNGWFSIDSTNANTGVVTTAWYYANEDGSCLLNGFHDLDGKTYYFSTNGASYRKQWLVDEQKRRRYFNAEGYMERNTWFATESTSTITGPASSVLSEDEITTTKETWYYADEDGYVVMNDKLAMGEKEFKLNANGTMFTGWDRIKGTSEYYYYKEDGSKAYGWQLITNPSSDETIYNMYQKNYGDLAWFYFDPDENGRVAHSGTSFTEKVLEGKTYCVNRRGMIQYGWAPFKDSTNLDSFHYYMPVETGTVSSVAAEGAVNGDELHQTGKDGYLPGERVSNKWVWSEAPYQMECPDKTATWYYIRENGLAERASRGKIELKNMDGYHAIDPYGRTYSGFGYRSGRNGQILAVYYFDVDNYNTAVTGLREIDLNGRKETFLFDANCEGVTGTYDGYLYYRGRRQTGAGTRGVSYDLKEGSDESSQLLTYLVDETGKILKNADNLEGSGGVWSSDDYGKLTQYSGTPEQASTVAVEDMKVFIGDFSD